MNAPAFNLRETPKREVRDEHGMTAAERYGPGNAYGFVLVGMCGDRVQTGNWYYASEDDARADARDYERTSDWRYFVERVRTSEGCLKYGRRLPNLPRGGFAFGERG